MNTTDRAIIAITHHTTGAAQAQANMLRRRALRLAAQERFNTIGLPRGLRTFR